MDKNLGLYIHIPFCKSKCAYCDFYSLVTNDFDTYQSALINQIKCWGKSAQNRVVDTVYFGGGTPNLLGAMRLTEILEAVKENFTVSTDAEITVEANPETVDYGLFLRLRQSGFNRLSMGFQTSSEKDLNTLSRRHTKRQQESAVFCAKKAGFDNISLDLMLGISSTQSLINSIEFCDEMKVKHISAYILKIEEGTKFFKDREKYDFPDEEETAGQYELMIETLEKMGYKQYEISNFSKENRESRHNLKYWNCEEYIGIGPSAHSYFLGNRFFYDRDLLGFCENPSIILDGKGGSFEEYLMLALRLSQGLKKKDCIKKGFEKEFFNVQKKAKKIPPNLLKLSDEGISLTKEGFLLSNAIISSLI